MSSKKELRVNQEYYSSITPGQVVETNDFSIPSPESTFDEVLRVLVDQKYVHFTSDGYYHFLPKGVFIQDALSQKATEVMTDYGALRYRFAGIFTSSEDDQSYNLIKKFLKQVFTVQAEQERIKYLKYASDPQLFTYFSGRTIDTPYKIYSPDYFYRVIQTGELKPLIQPREFYMTDYHAFQELNDFEAYIEAAILNANAVRSFASDVDWYLNIDTNRDFFENNQENIVKMLDALAVNAVINITSERTHYYSIQNQYIVNYFFGNKTQLANLQFDQQNGTLFDINSSRTGDPVSIVHGTLYGRTEKVMALVFGKLIERYKRENIKPCLPIWLSPTVVRIVPVMNGSEIAPFLTMVEKRLKEIRCRYDIDMRDIPFYKKIKKAEQEWIPFQLVLGENEATKNELSVRDRYKNTQYSIALQEFLSFLTAELQKDINCPQTVPTHYQGSEVY